jgi:hypothetical protein
MSSVTQEARREHAPAREQDNQATLTRIWIGHGVFWLALMAYVWIAWVLSGDFKVNGFGRGLEPDWYVILVRAVEIVFGIGVSGWILWHFVIGPKRKTGSLSFDGMFFLAVFLLCFQEPWMNWINLQFFYSTTFVNFGSWLEQIPGWSLPNGRLIPLPIVYCLAYLWMLGLGAWAGSRYMTRQRRLDPGRSVGRLVWQTFALMVVVDFVVESIMVHTSLINYPRTIKSLTLWYGTDHQFPIYEVLAWPGTFIMLSCLHFFRDDKGRSFPERGIDRIHFRSGRMESLARFAAIAGACQLTIRIAFNIPYQVYGLHAGPVPKVYDKRPWRTAGVCGPHTPYDCGGYGVLMPRHDTPTNRVTP